jgi:hypothetical protein
MKIFEHPFSLIQVETKILEGECDTHFFVHYHVLYNKYGLAVTFGTKNLCIHKKTEFGLMREIEKEAKNSN